MKEKKRIVLDSYAVLAWLQDEEGAQKVEESLVKARDGKIEVFINVINLGEVYYKYRRRFGEEKLNSLRYTFSMLPLKVVTVDEERVYRASLIKSDHAIAFADCFVAATAIEFGATILTGDPEFKKIEKLVNFLWIP